MQLMIYTSITKPWNSVSKESACNARDLGLIPGSGRSPRDGNGNPLQYSCLENPMDRGASLAIVHGINKSWTWLSDWITTTNWYVISTSITKHRYYQFVVAVKSLSCVQHFVTPWTVACQASLSFTISWICSSSCPLSWWYHPTISSSVTPFSSFPQSFPASGSSTWVSVSHQVAKVLELHLQHQSFQWTFRVGFL